MHWIDPDHLPRLDGIVDRFLVNPHGGTDGLLLLDGMEVHVPPHLGVALRAAVQPGAAISVFGVRPRGARMVSAVAIDAGPGRRIVDNGPPADGQEAGKDKPGAGMPRSPMEAEGLVHRVLHGPKGEARGVLLEDGRIVRIPPHDAKEHRALLQPGVRLAARGPGLTVEGATVIDAKEIGATLASLEPVKPKDAGKHPKPPQAKHGGPHPKLPAHA